jgi:D-lactate dehydrogenase (cytochrome)
MFTTDICVPISRLADCIVELKRDVFGVTYPVTIVGHVGDGNVHMAFIPDPNDREELADSQT